MSSFERVKEALAETFPIERDRLTEASNLNTDLDFDSLDRFEMRMALEEECNVEVNDDMAEQWQTVGDIVKYIDLALIEAGHA